MSANSPHIKKPTTANKRYISEKDLDIVKKPSQYFNSYSLFTGMINYKGTVYNLKKIEIKENINIEELPEVQIVKMDYRNPYLIDYYDYIIEQEEKDGVWVDKAIYFLMENSDYDLKTYVLKYGALPLDHMLRLVETLIGANYYLQKDLEMAHGDVRPQNVRIIMKEVPDSKKKEPIFKLSYFDDILSANTPFGRSAADALGYMAPELLCSSQVSSRYYQTVSYTPVQELKTLIEECPDEIRYDPCRADVFSAGLIAFSAATGIFFSLTAVNPNFETMRDGPKETQVINQNLKMLKMTHRCEGFTELLRIMLNPNPLQRYDFEELAIRLNKIAARSDKVPRIHLMREDPQTKQEYELLKQSYWELQEMVDEMKEKEFEYRNTIERLTEEIQRLNSRKPLPQPTNTTTQSTNNFGNILNDLSAIVPNTNEESFLSTKTFFLDGVDLTKKDDLLERNDRAREKKEAMAITKKVNKA